MTSQQPSLDTVVRKDIHSESSLPLINYLINANLSSKPNVEIFHDIKTGVGVDERPPLDESETREIPDESDSLEEVFMQLFNQTPSPEGKGQKVTIIGGGVSGLCTAYELKRAGFKVQILEASSRVGGRVKTFRDPVFAPGLHGEGGAMRIPSNHYLLHAYINHFGMHDDLFTFEMENKFVYVSGYGKTLTYKDFDGKLKDQDPELLECFPGLHPTEKGKTCDELFTLAVQPVVDDFWAATNAPKDAEVKDLTPEQVVAGYAAITKKYDKYSLRSYLTEVAKWSPAAINLYDLGNAHVVFENGFIESFKDAFLSSNKGGAQAGMQQLKQGMDAVPNAFISPKREKYSLRDDIVYGARVTYIGSPVGKGPVTVRYETPSGKTVETQSEFLVLAIPYTALRSIEKSRTFDPMQEMAIREVRYVEVTKVLLQYKQRWWEQIFTHAGVGLDGGLVCDLPIRYTMFPRTEGNPQVTADPDRGVIMAAYTFEQDATILGAMPPSRRIRIAAQNLDRIFPDAHSLDRLEAGASQVFPADELAGGSAFCYFGPMQKTEFLMTMCATDWESRVFFAGEQASYTHGWIQGALEAALRCVLQVSWAAANASES